MIYLSELEKNNLILKLKHRIHKYPVYIANRDNENFRFYKKIDRQKLQTNKEFFSMCVFLNGQKEKKKSPKSKK